MKGFKEVFTFTFTQQVKVRSVRILTVVIALILFIVPAAIMVISESGRNTEIDTETEEIIPGGIDGEETDIDEGMETSETSVYSSVLWVNDTDIAFNEETVNSFLSVRTNGASCEKSSSLDNAVKVQNTAGSASPVLVLHLLETDDSILIRSILTSEEYEDRKSYNQASLLASVLQYSLPELVETDTPADNKENSVLSLPLTLQVFTPEDEMSEEEMANEQTREILVLLLPYVNIMLIYFLVLYYGQSAANSVILEKTSKLMDTFLVSVKPKSMIFGKILAIWAAALLQFFIWILALIAGLNVGLLIIKSINPDPNLGIIRLFALLKDMTSIFSFTAILEAILLIMGGFLLYCCIAGICASFASKPEELSNTIAVFSLTLVISFLVCLRVGFLSGEMAMGAKWFDFIPFTAILITPSRILLGYVSLGAGLVSILIVVGLSLVFILFSGRVYKMMSLYKGKIPGIKDIVNMLKTE